MKKKWKKSLYIFCLLIFICTFCYAGEIEINTNNSLKENSEFNIEISINLAELEQKIYFLQGQLEYDKDVFEEVTQEDITTLNTWHGLVFNSENGKFVIENDGKENSIQGIMNIKLKTKKNINKDSATIQVKGIKVIGENEKEEELENATIKVAVSNDKQADSLANKILPFTGSSAIIIFLILVVLAIAILMINIIKRRNKN